jgi:hypothetical protein
MSESSAFDPEEFLSGSIDGTNSTVYVPCPIGEYQAIVEGLKPRQWSKDGSSGVYLDIQWRIEDPQVLEALGRDKVIVTQSFPLEFDANSRVSTRAGANVPLGRVREAVNLNTPGQLFSITQLIGQFAKVQVKHDIFRGEPQAKVASVSRL